MSVDLTPKELERESDEELQRRMNLYKPESGAYKAAEAVWKNRRNAPKVRRELVKIIVNSLALIIGLPASIYGIIQIVQFAKTFGLF